MKIKQLIYALLLIAGTSQAQVSRMFIIKKDSSGFELTPAPVTVRFFLEFLTVLSSTINLINFITNKRR